MVRYESVNGLKTEIDEEEEPDDGSQATRMTEAYA